MKEAVSIIDTLKLALEALETLHDENMDYLVRNKLGGENNQCMVFARDVIKSIKRTLAQPEQEPVATVTSEAGNPDVRMSWWHEPALPVGTKFYTTPPQHVLMAEHWKSMYEQLKASAYTPDDGALTEEQINQLKKAAPKRPWVGLTHEDIDKAIEDNQRFGGFRKVGFAYDLEEILKEKNNGE
jgi:hypothetical protein